MKIEEIEKRRRICFEMIMQRHFFLRTNSYINWCMTIAFDWDMKKIENELKRSLDELEQII